MAGKFFCFLSTTTKHFINNKQETMPSSSPEPFIELYEALSDAFADSQQVDITTLAKLQELFDTVAEDVKLIFDLPGKSAQHSEALRSGMFFFFIPFFPC